MVLDDRVIDRPSSNRIQGSYLDVITAKTAKLFAAACELGGVVAERSLQPGTGATSGVAGLYANYAAQDGSLWFTQLQFQGA